FSGLHHRRASAASHKRYTTGRAFAGQQNLAIILSSPMKIIVADNLPPSALDALRIDGWTVDARSGRSAAQLAADVSDADALLVRSATKVDARLSAAASRLRIVARAGVGVDIFDVEAASTAGILGVNA